MVPGQRGRQGGPARPERKIDVAAALMMAMGRAMAENKDATDLSAFLAGPGHRLITRPTDGPVTSPLA